VPSLDHELGIEVYATKTPGVSGAIRMATEDFKVEEVLVDGSKATVEGSAPTKVLGSTISPQRFLLCVLVKRNWDTFIAVKNVAIALGIDQGRVQIAGITKEDAAQVNLKHIQLKPVGYLREALSTFYLLGNSFTIGIQGIELDESIAKERICQVSSELDTLGGIPNYYGHQRFGTTRPITHLVGKALFQGNLKEAAMLFLAKPSVHEHPLSRLARQQLQESGDFRQAMQDFPKPLRFERLMLSHLSNFPDDFVGAFHRLPIKLQAVFVRAYQSYLFNRLLGGRLKHGLSLDKAEVGDFVVGLERNGLPLVNVAKTATEQTLAAVNGQIEAGRIRVALPLVGLRQKLSRGVMGKLEAEILAKEGIRLDGLQFNELSRASGKGGLRTALTPVKDFKLQQVTVNTVGKNCSATLSFMLFRGCYATVLLREVMKPSDLVAAGF
jgi:tRNA pseudouridine13 synthase